MKKKVAVLGATGSIGRSTLDVIRLDPESFELVLLTAHRNIDALKCLASEFPSCTCLSGDIICAIKECGADIVVNSNAK